MVKYLFYLGLMLALSCSNKNCDNYWFKYNNNSACYKYFTVEKQENCQYSLMFWYGILTTGSKKFKIEGELNFSHNTIDIIQNNKTKILFNYTLSKPLQDSIYCTINEKIELHYYTLYLENTIKTVSDTIYKFKFDNIYLLRDIDNLTFFISKTNGVVGMYASVDNPYYKIDEITMHTGNIYGDEKYILHTSHY